VRSGAVRRSAAPGAIVAAAALACARQIVTVSSGTIDGGKPASRVSASDRTLRIGLAVMAAPRVSSQGSWRFYDEEGERVVADAGGGASWRVESAGGRLRAVSPEGRATDWVDQTLVARPEGTSLLAVNGKRYRGELLFVGADTGIRVVNRVRMDDYLRGVVPLEIGTSASRDAAAVEAQAITARSYAYAHVGASSANRPYDVTASVSDQLYGGAGVETVVGNAAIDATRGLVLQYDGRVVNAPYHSACGGSTAAAEEVWRTRGEPYLQPVSDRIPGTDRYYCDIAPRFRWTRTLDGATLREALVKYLGTYTAVPGPYPGTPRDVVVDTRTPSGRVGTLKIATDRGNYVLRGNDVRYVLRAPGGEILNSTNFSVETTTARDGSLSSLVLRGTGYGHGIGMCQWGAIGRARAGQDFRTILRAYYPGTTIGAIE
jgi:stage II sporulation protein D